MSDNWVLDATDLEEIAKKLLPTYEELRAENERLTSLCQTWDRTMLAENQRLRAALRDLLPMAEQYLWNAPSHPDNAKIETARAALADQGKG